MTVGPDGALYLVDYYRQMIEHPEWTSSHVHDHTEQAYAGQDRGRIWRISATGRAHHSTLRVELGKAPEEELVRELANPNAWWRRTAQRLLIDRQSRSAVAPLRRLFEESPSPLGRLHSLHALDGLGALDEGLVAAALRDPEAGVRENAIRLAEPRLGSSAALTAAVLSLTDDPNPKVRFQLLLTLGAVASPASRAAQDRLLIRDIEDEWVQVAALSASPERAAEYLTWALRPRSPFAAEATPGRTAFLRLVGTVVAAQPSAADWRRALRAAAGAGDLWWRTALLEGLARGTQGRGSFALRPEQEALLVALAEDPVLAMRRASLQILEVAKGPAGEATRSGALRAVEVARDENATPERRADALRLVALGSPAPHRDLFVALTNATQAPDVQAAAVRALGRIGGEDVGRLLLARWRSLAAPARSQAADVLLREPGTTRLLVEALHSGDVQAWTLSFWQKRDLLMNEDPAIRDRARPLLEEAPGGREAVVKRYQAALDLTGDARQGERVFTEACSKCHRFNDRGAAVGPDLGTVRHRAPSLLLADILAPSRAITHNYESYTVETDSGDTHDGVVAAQSPTAVVLRREGGEETVVPRARIRKMYASNLSAMPADLERQIDLQQMADLLAYLTAPR
jgi:putative heme-binding domain-containing protein